MSIFATIRCHEIKIPYWPAVAAFLLGRGDPDCLIGPRRGRYSPTDRHYHSYQGRRRLADSSRCPRIHLRSGGRNTPDSGARVLSLRRSRAHRRLPFPLLGAATKPGNRQFPLPGCGRIRSGKRRSGPRQVGAPAPSWPAPLHASDYPRQQPTEPEQGPTETPTKTALPARMKVESEGPRQTIPAASTPVAVTTLGPAPTPEPGTIPGTAASVPKAVSISSGKLRARITDALDREDLQQVKSLCKEAMVTDAALAEFCGIVFFIQPEPSQAAARAAGSVDLGIEESKSCKAKGTISPGSARLRLRHNTCPRCL